jgi:glycosyltransferase domain-containing protein
LIVGVPNWPDEHLSDEQCGELLRELTVVVLSHNRPRMLQGIVDYWSNWPVSILILDGSDEPVSEQSLGTRTASISVFAAADINERLLHAASNISTPFACLQADDDFNLARGTARAIKWLQQNPDYTCVSSDVQLFDAELNSWSAPPGRTVVADTPHDRIVEHFTDYRFSYFYGIQRAPALCAAMQAVRAATLEPDYVAHPHGAAGELGLEICGAALGKLGLSPEILLLKRVGNESAYVESQSSNQWLEDRGAHAAVRAWRRALSKELSPHVGCHESTVDGWIGEAMDQFCRREGEKMGSVPLGQRLLQSIAMRIRPVNAKVTRGSSEGAKRWQTNAHHTVYGALRSAFRTIQSRVGFLGTPKKKGLDGSKIDDADLAEVKVILDAR